MAGLKGKSGPPGNMNAFKHGLAAIQKRREEGVPTEHEETVRQQILDGLMIGLNMQRTSLAGLGQRMFADTLTREAMRCVAAMASYSTSPRHREQQCRRRVSPWS